MNKREFLQKLREYLSYELPARYIEKNLSYYSDYIDNAVSEGKNIQDVIDELGDPQLIAKTIVNAAKAGADGIPNTSDDVDFTKEVYGNGGPEDNQGSSRFGSGYRDSYNSASGTSRDAGAGDSSFGSDGTGNTGDINNPSGGWHVYNMGNGGCLFAGIIVFLAVFCVFSIIGAILGAMSPILAPICIILMIVWLLGRRN